MPPIPFDASIRRASESIDAMRNILRNASRALPGRGAVELPQGMLMRLARYKADLNVELQKMGALATAPVRPRTMHPGERLLSFNEEAREVTQSLNALQGKLTDFRDALYIARRMPPSRESELEIAGALDLIATADALFEQAWAGLESAVAPF